MRTALQMAGGVLLAWLAGRASSTWLLSDSLSAPAASSVAPAPSVAAPSALGLPPSAPPAPAPRRPAPVASYTLKATLDPVRHTIAGEGEITWRNASQQPQSELYVHLYLNAFKNERTVFLRTPIGGFRGVGSPSDLGRIDVTRFAVREMGGADVWPADHPTSPGDPDDETDIRVELPRPVAPGEAITVEVAWVSHLPSISLRTGHFGSFHMAGQWFPKIARLEPDGRWAHFPFHRLSEFYADFGAYDVTVDVPEGFVVGATGRIEREARAGGRVVRRFVQADVHDFAFAAWDGFRELRVTTEDGVAIRCLYPAGAERLAALEVDVARFGLGHFGAAFGRYPYETLTIVHPPEGAEEAGGMEYPTLITTGGDWHAPVVGDRSVEGVTVHELAHQWFYGLVATDEHRYPFLDEGLTTYAEVDALRARYGDASAAAVPGLSLDLRSIHRAGAIDGGHDGAIAQAASDFLRGSDYARLVYARPATLLATLGGVYGDDLVRRALGRYARDNRFGHPGPDALLAAVREVVGEGAAEALRVGIFERGWVDYVVEGVHAGRVRDAAGDGRAARQDVHEGYAVVRRRGTLRLPVDVDLHGADGSVQRVRWEATELAARLPYAGASPLVAAVIDPEHRVLLDEDLTNNAGRRDRPALALRVLDRASFALGAMLLVTLP